MEPPVSEPSAAKASSGRDDRRGAAAGAAGDARGIPRIAGGPKAEFSVEEPMANSSMLVRPKGMAPAARSLRDDGGVVVRDDSPRRIFEAQVQGSP